MPTTFELVDSSVRNLLAEAIADWHPYLHRADVTIGCLFASNPEDAAVKHGGYPAAATVKIVSLKDRVTKRFDVEMLIDYAWWEQATASGRLALLDHELSHVRLAKIIGETKDGRLRFKKDSLGRPKLKLVPGDAFSGDGFAAVIERHGENAAEFSGVQKYWAWAQAARMGEFTSERRPA
jgi:hypothetical protein